MYVSFTFHPLVTTTSLQRGHKAMQKDIIPIMSSLSSSPYLFLLKPALASVTFSRITTTRIPFFLRPFFWADASWHERIMALLDIHIVQVEKCLTFQSSFHIAYGYIPVKTRKSLPSEWRNSKSAFSTVTSIFMRMIIVIMIMAVEKRRTKTFTFA